MNDIKIYLKLKRKKNNNHDLPQCDGGSFDVSPKDAGIQLNAFRLRVS